MDKEPKLPELAEAEEDMCVSVNKACKGWVRHLGKAVFNMWVSAEVVEDIGAEPREDLILPVKLETVEDLSEELHTAMGHRGE